MSNSKLQPISLVVGSPSIGAPALATIIPLAARRLRIAVQAAIRAYAESGCMLDAALAYAAHGFPVFPLTIDKEPVPARDRDARGKPIPGTGSFKKATTDPIQIHKWWDKHEYLIGLPMGPASGVWCLDIDTSEDHADGVAEWEKIAAQHDPIVTREHRSATDGPHLIFSWNAELPIGCSLGALPKKGISVKGEGSYIVVPPSVRKQRAYSVHRDIDPVDQPQWLTDLILQGRTPGSGSWTYSGITADFDEVAAAMAWIPNNDEPWEEFKSMGMRIYAALGEEGFPLFYDYSQQSPKHIDEKTLQAWEEIQSSPPTRTGVEKIFKMAREHGWVRKGEPTYSLEELFDKDMARRKIRSIVRDFLESVAIPESERDCWSDFYFEHRDPDWPLVRAMCLPTGIGKTRITIKELAAWLRSVKLSGPIIYAVPQHRLSGEIEKRFAQHGVNARIFRGRKQEDPERRHKQPMCLNPTAVELAMKCHADIGKSCCFLSKKKKCRFFDPDGPSQCGYQRQQIGAEKVQVWIVAGDMLFHTHEVFGEPAAIIIDEGIWRKGIRGIEGEDETRWMVAIERLLMKNPFHYNDGIDIRNNFRHDLGTMLQRQEQNGAVVRQHLDDFPIEWCNQALQEEWKFLPKLELEPGMSEAEIDALAENEELIEEIRHGRRVIRIWEEVRRLLWHPKIAVSGRLTLKKVKRRRVIEWRGVAPISEQFWVPTLMLDATLPDLPILQVYHPQVEKVADIKAAMSPHVRIRQVLHAPTSSSKLDHKKHLDEMLRYVLTRYVETERKKTLVICQQKVEDYLLAHGLPSNIHVEHYNNITGRDIYRDVRLQILLGRVAPGPRQMEALGAALSGAQPIEVQPNANGFIWYPQVTRGIRLSDGSGRVTSCDYHPDAFIDPVRWQVHEGEQMQAIGRSRGINREANEPLDIDLLFDSYLPITVDEVFVWQAPSASVEMVRAGVVLTSRTDMIRAWPQTWDNDTAARRTLEELRKEPSLAAFRKLIADWQPVTYQLVGPKMKRRFAYFDLIRIPDPENWLTQHLGPVKVCINAGPKF